MIENDIRHIDTDDLVTQELKSVKEFEEFYGKHREGFSDFSMAGINSILSALYLRETEPSDSSDPQHALRYLAYHHYNSSAYSFKASYNLVAQGYYSESATILRSILESFIRLRFLERHGTKEDILIALAGHSGIDGKSFRHKNRTMFDDVAPGLYHFYRILCDITHGGIIKSLFKEPKALEGGMGSPDTGVYFRPLMSTFVTNIFALILLAHLKHLPVRYPEITSRKNAHFDHNYAFSVNRLTSLAEQMKSDSSKDQLLRAMAKIIE